MIGENFIKYLMRNPEGSEIFIKNLITLLSIPVLSKLLFCMVK